MMKRRMICAVLIMALLLALMPALALADEAQTITGRGEKNMSRKEKRLRKKERNFLLLNLYC